jgi:uncharacterized protein (TIGR03086 family)
MTNTVEAPELLTVWGEVADGFGERLAPVRPGDWAKPTCCADWDVAQLVGHAIASQRSIPKALGVTGAIDTDGDDLAAVWDTVRAAAGAAFSVPGALGKVIQLSIGEMPAGDALGFVVNDLLIHTWDLARAIGAGDRLHPGACAISFATLVPMDEQLRVPGFYGPKLEPAAGAGLQDKLLAFLGRQV